MRRIDRITGKSRHPFGLPDLAEAQHIEAKQVDRMLPIAIPTLAPESPPRIAVAAAREVRCARPSV